MKKTKPTGVTSLPSPQTPTFFPSRKSDSGLDRWGTLLFRAEDGAGPVTSGPQQGSDGAGPPENAASRSCLPSAARKPAARSARGPGAATPVGQLPGVLVSPGHVLPGSSLRSGACGDPAVGVSRIPSHPGVKTTPHHPAWRPSRSLPSSQLPFLPFDPNTRGRKPCDRSHLTHN